jgi:quercetin dioxygenase-like cupin family protein
MYVIEQTSPAAMPLPGVAHATLAGHADGLRQLSVWRQTLAPGAGTPAHRHDCDEVVLCEAGTGELLVAGRIHPFAAGSTLVLPRGIDHQFRNTGSTPMQTVGIFGATPVGTFGPDGESLELPWRS